MLTFFSTSRSGNILTTASPFFLLTVGFFLKQNVGLGVGCALDPQCRRTSYLDDLANPVYASK